MDQETRRGRAGGRSRALAAGLTPVRRPDYRQLRHPFQPQTIFSADEVAVIHDTALRVLEELGMMILLPEARDILAASGARLRDEMVFFGRDLVAEALGSAPRSIRLRAANPERGQIFENGAFITTPGSGCPNVSDLRRGRRPGDHAAFIETVKLHQSYDALHVLGPSAEPQDIPVHLRHYAVMQGQMQFADKPMFVNARGQAQVRQSLEMIQLGLNLSDAEFANGVWAYTVINTNSPRLLDIPMAQGLIDFARAGQMSVVTPFCLAGAMAPVTVAGALTLQHAEALAGIVLTQMARSGAPVSYGGFSSNVDMKSGAPAFGTPEQVKMQIGAGQLARHVGLPWRSAAGASSNLADAQGATETTTALWGMLMANATLGVHSAGWLEGGLTFGYEKFITDMEALQTIAELCAPSSGSAAEIGFDALAEVEPGGHFFATRHTMDRYATAFYAPLVADLSNHGTWAAAGGLSAAERAHTVWKRNLSDYRQPPTGLEVPERLARYIEEAARKGGAAPVA